MKSKEKLKKQVKGITLIALVVTIIVLLILAGVAINLTIGQNGIFTRAQNAVDASKTASDIEQLQMSVVGALKTDGTVDRELLNSSLPSNFVYGHGSYINTINEKEYKIDIYGNVTEVSEELDSLEKYLIGENKEGRQVSELLNANLTFKETVNDKTLMIKNYYAINKRGYALVEYNNKMYELETKDVDGVVDIENIMNFETNSVKLVYEPKGDEGKKVSYSYDGSEENKKEWTILYDDGEYIEILSPEVIGSGYTIGDSTNINKTVEQYNNAIDNLNKECEKLITNTNKISVRCVGSNPLNPNSKNTEKFVSDYLGTYSGKGNSLDTNFVEDLARINLNNVIDIDKEYWMASTGISETDEVAFLVNSVNEDGIFSTLWIWGVNTQKNAWSAQTEAYLRPIVRLKKSEVSIIE